MNILFRLLLAHIVADFFLQTDKMNSGKNAADGRKWLFLLLHSFTHAVATYVFVAQWTNFSVPAIIFLSHFIIDTIKTSIHSKSVAAFVLDQIAHISVILFVAFQLTGGAICEAVMPNLFNSNKLIIYAIGYALVLKPTSIVMNLPLNRWDLTALTSLGLPHAGKWIGYLERILILTFILTGNLEGVGFLLAAKSVFRFGDLNKAKDIKITEYVMIGTLISFTIAILVGYAVMHFAVI